MHSARPTILSGGLNRMRSGDQCDFREGLHPEPFHTGRIDPRRLKGSTRYPPSQETCEACAAPPFAATHTPQRGRETLTNSGFCPKEKGRNVGEISACDLDNGRDCDGALDERTRYCFRMGNDQKVVFRLHSLFREALGGKERSGNRLIPSVHCFAFCTNWPWREA